MEKIIINLPEGMDLADVLREHFPHLVSDLEDQAGLFDEVCEALEYLSDINPKD